MDPSTGLAPKQRVARIKALGNSVVPQVAEWVGMRIMEEFGDVEEEA